LKIKTKTDLNQLWQVAKAANCLSNQFGYLDKF